MPAKDISWWNNFRRWSTQAHAASVVVTLVNFAPVLWSYALVMLPDMLDLVAANTQSYWPLMSDAHYAIVVGSLNLAGIILRNLKQKSVT